LRRCAAPLANTTKCTSFASKSGISCRQYRQREMSHSRL
jgi:hypothetical protein